MIHFEKLCKALARYEKDMHSYAQIWQSNAKYVSMARFGQGIQSYGQFFKVYVPLCPRYTRSWEDMTTLCKYIQVMAKYAKLYPDMGNLYKDLSKNGDVIQNS